jgi:hypothetical protein
MENYLIYLKKIKQIKSKNSLRDLSMKQLKYKAKII